MKMLPQDLLRKIQIPVMIASSIIPVLILLLAYFSPVHMLWAWLPGVIYVVLAVNGLWISGKWRVMYGLFCALLLTGLGFLVFRNTGNTVLLMTFGVFAAAAFWSVQIGRWAWHEELSLPAMIIGFGIHVISQFILQSMTALPAGEFSAAKYSLLAAFWLFMFTAILRMNRDSLFFATHGARRASAPMQRQNTVFAVLLAVLAGVMSAASPVLAAARGIVMFLLRLLSGSGSPEDADPFGKPAATDPVISTEISDEGPPPSEAFLFLDKVLLVLTYVICAAALCGAVILLVRVLILLAGKLVKWLSRFTQTVSEDYVDEITDLRDDPAQRETLLGKLRRRIRFLDDRNMSSRDQIRARYRKLSQRRNWAESSTARENLPEEMAVLYEKARYSSHEVDQTDSDQFRYGSKKL